MTETMPLPDYPADKIIVYRDAIAKAVDALLSERYDYVTDGVTRQQMEQAVWHWLANLIDDLCRDADEQVDQTYSNFDEYLERAQLIRETLDGCQPVEHAAIWRNSPDPHTPLYIRLGDLVRWNGQDREVLAVHRTEAGDQYLTLADEARFIGAYAVRLVASKQPEVVAP